jgi:pimeloyl-ACP methyl ester carboxylesterase
MSIRLPRLLPGHRGRGRPLAVLIGTLVLVGASSVSATAQTGHRSGAEPTIVLVHGAFADASSWNGVVERLQADGHTLVAPANPLRGIAADTAYLQSVLAQISGPVLLVGHSYGGAVMTNAATTAPTPRDWSTSPASPPTKANA